MVNYHPVSNLPFWGTAIETVVAEQLQAFLNDTSALESFHSGFMSGHGPEMVLVALTDISV